uniref:Uncharacterized protein n=1 Tax=Micrurus lemniscatus lemniscatus TaxID=129467 RepID=A0A2D4HSJ0_MICLE
MRNKRDTQMLPCVGNKGNTICQDVSISLAVGWPPRRRSTCTQEGIDFLIFSPFFKKKLYKGKVFRIFLYSWIFPPKFVFDFLTDKLSCHFAFSISGRSIINLAIAD